MSRKKQPTKRYRIPILIDRNERTMFRVVAEKMGVTVGEMVRRLVAYADQNGVPQDGAQQ